MTDKTTDARDDHAASLAFHDYSSEIIYITKYISSFCSLGSAYVT